MRMPRIPRHLTHRPEGTYHVIMRGNDRMGIFYDDADREGFLGAVAREIVLGTIVLHHYVLMGNHVHLVVRLRPDTVISDPLQRIKQTYAKHHSKRHGRTGHLWEGRFKSFLIESDAYLLTCGIYVGLNPVRAGIVVEPELYEWSSHRAYTTSVFDPLVTHDLAYLGLANMPALRREIYRVLTLSWRERNSSSLKVKRFFAKNPLTVIPPS